jgi:hypothetical protein
MARRKRKPGTFEPGGAYDRISAFTPGGMFDRHIYGGFDNKISAEEALYANVPPTVMVGGSPMPASYGRRKKRGIRSGYHPTTQYRATTRYYSPTYR